MWALQAIITNWTFTHSDCYWKRLEISTSINFSLFILFFLGVKKSLTHFLHIHKGYYRTLYRNCLIDWLLFGTQYKAQESLIVLSQSIYVLCAYYNFPLSSSLAFLIKKTAIYGTAAFWNKFSQIIPWKNIFCCLMNIKNIKRGKAYSQKPQTWMIIFMILNKIYFT